jgi:hypothetical protein
MGNALLRTLKFLLVTQSTPVLFSIPARHDNLDFGMPIRERGPKLFDDTRTFGAAELTEIWAWLDSVDAQTSGARYEAQFSRPPLTFRQDRYIFRGRIYSVAKCSDGRELLGSIIGLIPPTVNELGQSPSDLSKKF